MRSKSRLPLRGGAASLLFGFAALAGAQAAIAADAHPAAGALNLRNATMQPANAAEIAEAQRLAVPAGMRAYVDPLTGELRDQTPEEALAAAKAKAAAPRVFAKSAAVPSPLGGYVAELDESFMLHSVASVDASGRLRMQCVQPSGLLGALRGAGKEHGHAH